MEDGRTRKFFDKLIYFYTGVWRNKIPYGFMIHALLPCNNRIPLSFRWKQLTQTALIRHPEVPKEIFVTQWTRNSISRQTCIQIFKCLRWSTRWWHHVLHVEMSSFSYEKWGEKWRNSNNNVSIFVSRYRDGCSPVLAPLDSPPRHRLCRISHPYGCRQMQIHFRLSFGASFHSSCLSRHNVTTFTFWVVFAEKVRQM